MLQMCLIENYGYVKDTAHPQFFIACKNNCGHTRNRQAANTCINFRIFRKLCPRTI